MPNCHDISFKTAHSRSGLTTIQDSLFNKSHELLTARSENEQKMTMKSNLRHLPKRPKKAFIKERLYLVKLSSNISLTKTTILLNGQWGKIELSGRTISISKKQMIFCISHNFT